MPAYDGELQQVIEPPRSINYEHLTFLAWLYDHGHYHNDDPIPDVIHKFTGERRLWIWQKELMPDA